MAASPDAPGIRGALPTISPLHVPSGIRRNLLSAASSNCRVARPPELPQSWSFPCPLAPEAERCPPDALPELAWPGTFPRREQRLQWLPAGQPVFAKVLSRYRSTNRYPMDRATDLECNAYKRVNPYAIMDLGLAWGTLQCTARTVSGRCNSRILP